MSARAKAATPKRRRRRKLSKTGARFIAGFEGFRSDLYDDAAGHCTIGYGHLVHRGRRNGSEPAEFRRGIHASARSSSCSKMLPPRRMR